MHALVDYNLRTEIYTHGHHITHQQTNRQTDRYTTCNVSQASWLSPDPDNRRVLQPECHQTLPSQRRGHSKDQQPQLLESIAAVCQEVAIEDLVSKVDSQRISTDVYLARFARLVDDVAKFSEALLLVKQEKGLHFCSTQLLVNSLGA